MKLPRSQRPDVRVPKAERGYVLITLILFVALLAIGLTALAPMISQQAKRDREEELIHRGVQYSRAIKRYMKKFGRYPTRLEDLESSNNLRFLRKRYKDPITGKEFKLLHVGEVQMSFNQGIQGAIPAANLAAGAAAAGNPLTGGFGNSSFGNTSSGTAGAFGGGTSGGKNSFSTGFSFENNHSNASGSPDPGLGATPDGTQPGTQAGTTSDPNPLAPGSTPNQPGKDANQVFGGGPIVGVASSSKEKAIRVFNKKDKYNEWQFIYDPSTDRGGLLTTPNQPTPQGLGGPIQGVQGGPGAQPGQPSNQGSGFGFPGGNTGPPGGLSPTPQQSPYPPMPPDQGPQP